MDSIYNRYAFHSGQEFRPEELVHEPEKNVSKPVSENIFSGLQLPELLKGLGSKKFDTEDILLALITLLVFLDNEDTEVAIMLALLTLFGL